MVGLIWTIHTVHYPLFATVGDETYVEFQAAHVDRIGKLLLVPWAAEGATALLLLIWAWRQRDQALLPPLVIGGIAMGGCCGLGPSHIELLPAGTATG